MHLFKFSDLFVDADTGGAGETTNGVTFTTLFRCDKVCQAVVELAFRLLALLAQEVKGSKHFLTFARFVQLDIITYRIGGEEADDSVGLEPLLIDNLLQHRLGVVEELTCLFTLGGIVEDLWIASLELPGVEEEGPVDIGGDLLQGDITEGLYAILLR